LQFLHDLLRPKCAFRTCIRMFKLYVIFHKFLVPDCYETLSQKDIETYVRFVGVNSSIPKEIPESLMPYVIKERELPWYNPFLQFNRFCESSAFFHIWKNSLIQTDYIGFLHYDMLLKKEAIDFLKEKATATGDPILFTQMTLPARSHLSQIIGIPGWERIIRFYNAIFNKTHALDEIIDTEIPLYHSFVIHKDTFNRMMFFAERVIPYMFEMLEFSTTHLPFMIERLHGVFLAMDKLDMGTVWIPLPGIIHQDRLKDAWKGAL